MTPPVLRLHELVIANGRSTSPYVWRIRYALAHKGLAYESVPLGFTDIPQACGGRITTVPALERDADLITDSWEIAEYLDRTFPATPPLFAGPGEAAAVRLTDEWMANVIMRKLFAMYVLDIHDAVRPEDRPYFRQSREARLKGRTLESFTADRVAQRPAVREALAPLRVQLARFPFLGGQTPSYADYVAIGAFQWVASVSSLPLLAPDDRLRPWLERCFDLYGGIGRDVRMRALFES